MDQRLQAAEAALKAGRRREAVDLIAAVLKETPDQPLPVYRALVLQLFQLKDSDEGVVWAARATERFPKESQLWNVLGVMNRRLGRHDQALAALDQAIRLNPKDASAQSNKGNVYNDIGEGAKAEAIFSRLSRQDPRNADYQRALGRAYLRQGKIDPAAARFRQAIALRKDNLDAILDLSGLEGDRSRVDEAVSVIDKGLLVLPLHAKLLEAKATILRRAGRVRAAEAFLASLLPGLEDQAWLQHQLGGAISEYDRPRGNIHFRRAVELAPYALEYRMSLVESLGRTRTGDEGENIDEAYATMVEHREDLETLTDPQRKILIETCLRVGDYELIERCSTFRDVGRAWATTGRHTALLMQFFRVSAPEDRHELLLQHKMCGDLMIAAAARNPIRKPPPRKDGGKIRIGFMSSDLRQHPVAYFALPIFEHIDHDRFEVYCYSYFQGQEDAIQKDIASRVTAFRWNPEISNADAAQLIADDQLDILFELGGSTAMNRLEVMAYSPARKQASWLGYPHSAGLTTIDYLVADPFIVPPDATLMLEQPLMMPRSWISLGRQIFNDRAEITATLPEDRAGYITYGTANNPHKYNEAVLRTWARIVAATPGSKFEFLRPESGSAAFRKNIERYFEMEGVSADRLVFRAIRGAHLPYYNEIDITLDPFPLTGGTTTCEALWMGVPVISLCGEAFFERLSHSILHNSGVGHHSVDSLEAYVRTALALAGDRAQRQELRHALREQMRNGPLGRAEDYARDFYEAVARTLRG